jgi:hypothetical protein
MAVVRQLFLPLARDRPAPIGVNQLLSRTGFALAFRFYL